MKIALAGQPNCGKSTIFNMLSGLKQHIANYPGVTVSKKSGFFSYKNLDIELVDLPGTYSFSSYSLEERVAKDFILQENPDLILNIVDASNLKRNLYLTFQLLEISKPMVVVLNMIDVANRRGIDIDINKISKLLKCPVVVASGAKKIGKEEILDAIFKAHQEKKGSEFSINYEEIEDYINELEPKINQEFDINKRWLSIKALESDEVVLKLINDDEFTKFSKEKVAEFKSKMGKSIENFFAAFRYEAAEFLYSECVTTKSLAKETITDKIDKIVLNRWLSFPILFAIIVLVYQLSIVFGYYLTNYTWPYLASIKNFAIEVLPPLDITHTPMITELVIWLVNSLNALLNYLPIFFILFALIAILEDVGYMPRMAFILDRIFRKYGLHGQSTLPLVLGGAFVGGCAVPGLMSTKGIADDRARLATIFTVPLMNCLAKMPFYTLLLGAFFVGSVSVFGVDFSQMGVMLFYITTITIFTALILAKILTSTILKTRHTAPFVMELPNYHMPTFRGVILTACERVWVYIKKVCTIVLAVAIVLFALLQFPGVSSEEEAKFKQAEQTALDKFTKGISKTQYADKFSTREDIAKLLNFYDNYKDKKMTGGEKVDAEFKKKDEFLYKIASNKDANNDMKKINKELRSLSKERKIILSEEKNLRIKNSLLGMTGRALEPITQFAGFDWRVNIAFLSSFAARESAVATLGSIYEGGKTNQRAENMLSENSGYTTLHAAAIIIFMLLSPPCIAAMVVVKLQSNSWKFMVLATTLPFLLGIVIASLIFSVGKFYGMDGFEAMSAYYVVILLVTIILGILPNKIINWKSK